MRAHVDCFTSLDDLPRRLHRDQDSVVAAIKAAGCRFSTWDASATPALANTITELLRNGRLVDVGGAYPWTHVEIRERKRCPDCAGIGIYASDKGKRRCAPCTGTGWIDEGPQP